MDWQWFNISAHMRTVQLAGRRVHWVPYNIFNRQQDPDWLGKPRGHVWGAGLLQVGTRHLLYLGSMGLCVLGVWVLGAHNTCMWGRELR